MYRQFVEDSRNKKAELQSKKEAEAYRILNMTKSEASKL